MISYQVWVNNVNIKNGDVIEVKYFPVQHATCNGINFNSDLEVVTGKVISIDSISENLTLDCSKEHCSDIKEIYIPNIEEISKDERKNWMANIIWDNGGLLRCSVKGLNELSETSNYIDLESLADTPKELLKFKYLYMQNELCQVKINTKDIKDITIYQK